MPATKRISKRSTDRARKREQEAALNPKATGQATEATPGDEAAKRLSARKPAPTIMDVQGAPNISDAQLLADTAMIMGPNSDRPQEQPQEAPSEQAFRDARAGVLDPASVNGVTGRSIHDVQAEQNAQVAMLTSENPPKHIAEQKLEAAQRIKNGARRLSRQGLLPQAGRALSLHEMGQAKGYGTRA